MSRITIYRVGSLHGADVHNLRLASPGVEPLTLAQSMCTVGMWEHLMMDAESPQEDLHSKLRANIAHARSHFSLDRQTDGGGVRRDMNENIRDSFITTLNVISEISDDLVKEIKELRAAIKELKDRV